MRKMFLFMFLSMALLGCAYEGKTLGDYLNDPRSIIKDPHFAEYRDKRDDLERQYLRGEIAYADYVEQMDRLDRKYTEEVKRREAILSQ